MPTTRRPRRGFTLIEVLVVIMVGAILVVITLTQFGRASDRLAIQQAERTFESMLARARAMAVETGQLTRLNMHSAGDSLWIVRDGRTFNTVHMEDELGVDIRFSDGTATICMGPRGYAEESCTSITSPMTIEFSINGEASSLAVLPLGQIYR